MPPSVRPEPGAPSPANQQNFLIFDLETLPVTHAAPAQIIKVGALRPDNQTVLELSVGNNLSAALSQLDQLATNVDFVLGHNIIGHDIPLLEIVAPKLELLQLPRVDTLHLSPLAFPQNPYHRLIKDYKLIRSSLNSPLSDCRSAHTLFLDQQQALTQLAKYHRDEFLIYQALLAPANDPGLGHLLHALAGGNAISLQGVAERLPRVLAETDASLERDLKVCRTRLQQLIDVELDNKLLHWPLAYALAWLRVSGGNSVLPPWVNHQFPAAARLITDLRDTPCGVDACLYCRSTHDPRRELKRYFGFDDFRLDADGGCAQHDISLAGMSGESVLAVLATGGGKSICFQLPALNRYYRNGSLSIIISPLQSLMKDQVDGLLAHNIQCADALNGLLSMPERAHVLEKIQLGDIGILLVSPEQFRNRAFRNAIAQRSVGAWVFDEAHCLSKWGNDFRPDYLYAARFIREFTGSRPTGSRPTGSRSTGSRSTGSRPLAPIGCFTATAKTDVLEDIEQHFAVELGVSFQRFIGTPERPNLHFEVYPVGPGEKQARVHRLLESSIGHQPGGAVVFVASRKRAEEYSVFLIEQGWACGFFHAGLQPHEKKDVQDDFKDGALQAIVATNAFGMGVDKQDVRMVVHVDIPGSLENYLQEAGRAGRDQEDARCVLLYDERDIESQFRLSANSRLNTRDIQQILWKLRKEHRRRQGARIVMTAGEILADDGVNTSFDVRDRDAETKVVTAIAWLERGRFVSREENLTQVFPARLPHLQPVALERLQDAGLSEHRLQQFSAILGYLYGADLDQRISTDQLMELTGQSSEEISSALRQLEQLGLLENDTLLTMYLRHEVTGSSKERLRRSLDLEDALFEELRENAPDADQGLWQDLNLIPLTQHLRERCDYPDLLPLHVLRLLRSLAQDRDGDSQQRSALEIKQVNHDYLKLRIRGNNTWARVQTLGEKRRQIAAIVLPFLSSKIPPRVKGKDILASTTFGELQKLLAEDLALNATIKPEQRHNAIQHVLLYLHMQEVLTLNHGMTVMRRAMTIDVDASNADRRFTRDDFQKLDEHYRERRIQVHVMREYAELALADMAEALRLVMHYFSTGKTAFMKRYFTGREEVLELSTSEQSWRNIVGNLNAAQRRIVTDNSDANRLVLAGPGSGKTRVIVHRIAYLVRVLRVPPQSIIALTFNRHAADEVRQRLHALIDAEAWGLTVLTYHALAMRLLGISFAERDSVDEGELDELLVRATALLQGRVQVDGGDDLRDRLLQGYRYILVDEYQDIDDQQYHLVSALAQRGGGGGGGGTGSSTADAEDAGATERCLLAVGDDDQNIYQWRGGSNRYIERFCDEYEAEIDYLVENYRSTGAIIAASNRVIEQVPDRLKAAQAIRVNEVRAEAPAGGRWQSLDRQRHGAIMRYLLPASDSVNGNCQAQIAMAELQRLLSLENTDSWLGCAVLARSHRYLRPMQAWCEQYGIGYTLSAERQNALPLTRQRGFLQAVDSLRAHGETSLTVEEAVQRLSQLGLDADWRAFFNRALLQAGADYGDVSVSNAMLVDSLYDYARECRQASPTGLYLGTVHSAKGLEFRHVVIADGSWQQNDAARDEELRLYYVAMTRAQETLTLCEFQPGNKLIGVLGANPESIITQVFSGSPDPALDIQYQILSLKDIDIGYAGRKSGNHSIHRTIAGIKPGDPLQLRADLQNRYLICTASGEIIGRTSASFRLTLDDITASVAGIVVRFSSDMKRGSVGKPLCRRWEVVVPRMKGWLRSGGQG